MAAAAARAASIRIEKESPVEKRTYLSEVLARRARATRRSNSSQPLNLLSYGALSPAKKEGRRGEGMEAVAGWPGERAPDELGEEEARTQAQVLDRIAAL